MAAELLRVRVTFLARSDQRCSRRAFRGSCGSGRRGMGAARPLGRRHLSLLRSTNLHQTYPEEGLRMETLAVAPPRPDPAAELIDLSSPEDPFLKMKACSVVTYGVAALMRLPWSGLHRRNERGIPSLALDLAEESPAGVRWSVSGRGGV